MEEAKKVILPGEEGEQKILFDPTKIREITATTLADAHADASSFRKELEEGATDLGGGFLMQDEPVLVQRGPDGGIVRLTPLSEIPGVHYDRGQILSDHAPPKEVEAKPSPAPISRKDRDKLRKILANRLMQWYDSEYSWRDLGKFNPLRDGIPTLPSGSPEHLKPLPGTKLYPATRQQVYDYLLKLVSDRAKVIDTKRFGGGHLQDMAIRIE